MTTGFISINIKASELFETLYKRMHRILIQLEAVMADETVLQVLNEPGKAATSKSYMWLYRTGKYDHPIVLFDYQPSRSGKHPQEFLKGFSGYLNVDGYAGYNNLANVIRVACLAHIRRGYMDALKALPKDAKNSRTLANKGLIYCNQLYKVEQKIKDLSIEERYTIRRNESKTILNAFSVWLEQQSKKVLPKSKLGDAINYTINQWQYLENYLLDGRLDCDNNRSERSLKSFVLGRRSWLFSNTPKGAKGSALIYSIVETAKENKLKPYDYLTYLLDTLPNIDQSSDQELDELMPWSTSLPEEIRLKK